MHALLKYFLQILIISFLVSCGGGGSGGSNGNSTIDTNVGTKLALVANNYEVPVNTTVKLNAYVISGAKHVIGDVTSRVSYKHENTGVFSVLTDSSKINAEGNLVKYSQPGEYSVFASYDGNTSEKITIKVVEATLEKIIINSSYTSLPVGLNLKLTATGLFREHDEIRAIDITNDVSWKSSDNEVLAAAGKPGEYNAAKVGSSTVSISKNGLSSSMKFNVTDAVLEKLALLIPQTKMVIGGEQRIIALASYNSGAIYDVSSQTNYTITPAGAGDVRVDHEDNNLVLLTAKEAKELTIVASFKGKQSNVASIIVSDVTLQTLRIAPEKWQMSVGRDFLPSVIGIYSDGSNNDVSKLVSLASSDINVVTINSGNQLQAKSLGNVNVTAKLGSVTAVNDLKVNVTNAAIVKVQIFATTESLAIGGVKQQYYAVAVYENGGTTDITKLPGVVWQVVGDNNIAQISQQGLLTTGNMPGMVAIEVSYAGQNASVPLSIANEKMLNLMISASQTSLALGNTLQYKATAYYDSGKSLDVTNSVVWSSSELAVATIMPDNGVLTTKGIGKTNVAARFIRSDGVTINSNQLNLEVLDKAISKLVISGSNGSLPIGGITQQYRAFAYYDNGSVEEVTRAANINWSIMIGDSASIDNLVNKGLLTTSASKVGQVSITAKINGINAEQAIKLDVVDKEPRQLIITASESSLPLGVAQQYKAYAFYDNFSQIEVTNQVVWRVDDSSVANITPGGKLIAKAIGSTEISAQLPTTSLSARTNLAVVMRNLQSMVVSPLNATLPVGLTQQYHAFAFYDNGESQDISSLASWSSSAPANVTIDSNGLATAQKNGSTTIRATFNGKSAQTFLTVNTEQLKSVKIVPENLSLAINSSYQLRAVGSYDNTTQQELNACNWISNDSKVIVNPLTGEITTGGVIGSATITVTCSGKTAISNISIANPSLINLKIIPANITVAAGNSETLNVVGSFNNGSQQIITGCSWRSSDSTIARVTGGIVTGVANGATSVFASCSGFADVGAGVTVRAAVIRNVQILPNIETMPFRTQYQLRAIANYDNGSQQDISSSCIWSSNQVGVATVDVNSGLVTAQTTPGIAQITANCDSGNFMPTAEITAQPATLAGVSISPQNQNMAVGTQLKLEAIGNYANLDQMLISEQCAWSSSATAVATVDTTAGARGLIKALSVGTTTITASCPNGRVATTSINVSIATLQKVLVSPENISLPVNTIYQLYAIGTFDNGNQQTLTGCTWSKTSGSANVVVDSGTGSVTNTGTTTGIATIQASCNSKTAISQITIVNATLKAIKVSPAAITIPVNTSTKLEAVGSYDDGSSAVQSTGCNWVSSNTAVATVNPTTGDVNGLSAGSSTISTTCNGKSSTSVITVASRQLKTLKVSPETKTIPINTTYQLQAVGSYDDYGLEVLAGCTWSRSAGASSITVDSTGIVSAGTSIAASATIQASCSGKNATSTITTANRVVTSVTVSPSSLNMYIGESQALNVVAAYDDGSSAILTSGCNWTSANSSLVTANSASGVVTAVAAGGPVNITANCSGKSATTEVRVNNSNIIQTSYALSESNFLVPLFVRHYYRIEFKASSGIITDFQLLNLDTLPQNIIITGNSCSTVLNTTGCYINLQYLPLSTTEKPKVKINFVYRNNFGVYSTDSTKTVNYAVSPRKIIVSTPNVLRGFITCNMDSVGQVIDVVTCKNFTARPFASADDNLNDKGRFLGVLFSNNNIIATNGNGYQTCNYDENESMVCRHNSIYNTMSMVNRVAGTNYYIAAGDNWQRNYKFSINSTGNGFDIYHQDHTSDYYTDLVYEPNTQLLFRNKGQINAPEAEIKKCTPNPDFLTNRNSLFNAAACTTIVKAGATSGVPIYAAGGYRKILTASGDGASIKAYIYFTPMSTTAHGLYYCSLNSTGNVIACGEMTATINGVNNNRPFYEVDAMDYDKDRLYMHDKMSGQSGIYSCGFTSKTSLDCIKYVNAAFDFEASQFSFTYDER